MHHGPEGLEESIDGQTLPQELRQDLIPNKGYVGNSIQKKNVSDPVTKKKNK